MTDQPDLWTPAPRRRGVFAATSHEAGADVNADLRATQRRKILSVLAADGRLTYHEIAQRAVIELPTVCWRMKELRESGAVQFATTPNGAFIKQGHRKLVELAPVRRAG